MYVCLYIFCQSKPTEQNVYRHFHNSLTNPSSPAHPFPSPMWEKMKQFLRRTQSFTHSRNEKIKERERERKHCLGLHWSWITFDGNEKDDHHNYNRRQVRNSKWTLNNKQDKWVKSKSQGWCFPLTLKNQGEKTKPQWSTINYIQCSTVGHWMECSKRNWERDKTERNKEKHFI